MYHASVALGKPIKTRSRFKIVTFCCVEYTGSAKGISLLSDERYCMTITLCFCDNSIYHKICVLTCGRIIFAPTDLYKKKRQHNFCTVLVGADDGARTRYLHLGKVALYQMSYIRICGASGRNRTTDTGIFSPLLYRLSYRGKNWRPGTGSNRRPLA